MRKAASLQGIDSSTAEIAQKFELLVADVRLDGSAATVSAPAERTGARMAIRRNSPQAKRLVCTAS